MGDKNTKKVCKNSEFLQKKFIEKYGNSSSKNLDLCVYNYIKDMGKLPAEKVCGMSKQKINYHVKKLQKVNLVIKLGVGVWKAVADYKQEYLDAVKKTRSRSSAVANWKPEINQISFDNISNSNLMKVWTHFGKDRCLFTNERIIEIHHIEEKSKGGSEGIFNKIPVSPTIHTQIHQSGYTPQMLEIIKRYHDWIRATLINYTTIRGHGFVFTLKLPRIINWDKRESYLKKNNIPYDYVHSNKCQRIHKKYNGVDFKIHISSNSIVFYTVGDFFSYCAKESEFKAIDTVVSVIKLVERMFNTGFKDDGVYRLKTSRSHYGKVNDSFAKYCNAHKEKLQVSNKNGLWFLIDDSFNLNEAETVHPETSQKDMDDCIVPFFNSIKEKKGFTADFVLDSIHHSSNNVNQLKEIVETASKSSFENFDSLKTIIQEVIKSQVLSSNNLNGAISKISEVVVTSIGTVHQLSRQHDSLLKEIEVLTKDVSVLSKTMQYFANREIAKDTDANKDDIPYVG